MIPPYFIIMYTMLLGMFGMERSMCFILQYIYIFSQLIKSILIMFYFFQECDWLKMINHQRKILQLPEPSCRWFGDVIRYSGLAGSCSSTRVTINQDMHGDFVER